MERHTAKGCLVAVRLRAGQDALQMKRRPERVAGTPFFVPARRAAKEYLEKEAEAYFHLTGGIGEGRVGVADAAESRVEVEARIIRAGRRSGTARNGAAGSGGVSRGGDRVAAIENAGLVDVVEEVERLAKNFGGIAFTKGEFLGEAKVNDLRAR